MLSIGERERQELAVPECMQLLGTATLGRLGYTQGALPVIQPVTYRVRDGAVVMPAVTNSPVVAAMPGSIVVLSVDSFGSDLAEGWVITVVGPARVDSDSVLLEPRLVSGWRRTASDHGPTA